MKRPWESRQGHFTLAEHPPEVGWSTFLRTLTPSVGLHRPRRPAQSSPELVIQAFDFGLEP